ncbi:Aminopeptidase 2 mitochondrial [Xylographa bjoerkii]|nr:Aminopeptidase 2 mitochondrial [Xylographa bjoerkii]
MSGGIHVQQNRFLENADASEAEDGTLYPIFLALNTKADVQKGPLLVGRAMKIPLGDLDFFKLNSDHVGIYRTLYAPDRLNKLAQAMKKGLLSVEDRIGLIADASALASSGYQKTTALFDLLENMGDEIETLVWNQIVSCLNTVQDAWKFEKKDVRESLKHFTRRLVVPRATLLGWGFEKGEDSLLTRQMASLFESAAFAGDATFIKAAVEMFDSFIAGHESAIHPNLRRAVYAIALKHGGKKEYKDLLAMYLEARKQDEKDNALRGMGHTLDPDCAKELLDMMLKKKINKESISLPIHGLSHGWSEILWAWMKENWLAISTKIGNGLAVGAFVTPLSSFLGTIGHIKDAQAFFAKQDTSYFDQKLA